MPPAGVQKINVCFTCCSLCSYELDTILSNTVPLVWAESPWIAGNAAQAWVVFSPTKLVVDVRAPVERGLEEDSRNRKACDEALPALDDPGRAKRWKAVTQQRKVIEAAP